jgi:hypothetical protein
MFVVIYKPAFGNERQRIAGPFPSRATAVRFITDRRVPELYDRAWVLPLMCAGEPCLCELTHDAPE